MMEFGWGKFQFGKNFLKRESPTLNVYIVQTCLDCLSKVSTVD